MESPWSWLTTPPGVAGVLDPFGLVFAAVFACGFLTSAYLAGPGSTEFAHTEPHAAAIRHWASVGLWLFGAGLFFFAMRALQINPLSFGAPIWLVASVVALIVATIRFAAWRRQNKRPRADTGFDSTNSPRGEAPLSRAPRERGVGG